MTKSSINEVAKELLERSKAGKVRWEETLGLDGRNNYRVFFPDLSLRISRSGRDDEDEFYYELILTSDSGRTLDTLEPSQDQDMHQILSEMFILAEAYIHDSGISKALEYLKDV